MRRKISKLFEKAVGGHRPAHSAKLRKALQAARQEEADHNGAEDRSRFKTRYMWR